MNSRVKELFKNTGIFAIGNIGGKLLSFIIVPFYTYILTTEEYGRIDLLATIISLALPITTLLIHESAIRFLPTNEIDKKQAISNCFVVFIYGTIVVTAFFPLLNSIFRFGTLALIFYFVLILYTFNDIFGNCLKAIGKTVLFSAYGLTNTLAFLLLNVCFVLILQKGIWGYFLSMLISQSISAVIVFFGAGILQNVRISSVSKKTLNVLLRYSLPLIPNSLLWWIMTAGDKFIINFFLGDSANGIYSLSLKIPTILSLLFSIFSSAWQLSSIKESTSEDRSVFYSMVYRYLWVILAIGSSLLLVVIYPTFRYVLSSNYFNGWKYVGLLIVGTMISCLGTFLGMAYIVSKNTKWSPISTLFGAIVNVLLNVLLVVPMQLYGVVIGTIVGYFVVLGIRSYHARKFLGMELFTKKGLLLLTVLVFQCGLSLLWESLWCSLLQVVLVLLIILLCKKDLIELINRGRKV